MLCGAGYILSYCIARYRQGRLRSLHAVGKTGQIQNVCQPNALLTPQEMFDYADAETRLQIERVIACELETVPDPKVRTETHERLTRLTQGERDLYLS